MALPELAPEGDYKLHSVTVQVLSVFALADKGGQCALVASRGLFRVTPSNLHDSAYLSATSATSDSSPLGRVQ